MSDRFDAERQRIEAARREAERNGRELLTAAAVAAAFPITEAGVRDAVRSGRLEPTAIWWKHNLFRLSEVAALWRVGNTDTLEQMRRECPTVADGWAIWNVLHPQPIFRRTEETE